MLFFLLNFKRARNNKMTVKNVNKSAEIDKNIIVTTIVRKSRENFGKTNNQLLLLILLLSTIDLPQTMNNSINKVLNTDKAQVISWKVKSNLNHVH